MLHKILPILALLTATLFGDSIPRASGDQPGTQLIGEEFSQQLCFENDGNATGYEPQFELVTPAGIKLTAATFYGNPTISHQETCTAAECNVTNPLIGQQNPLFSPIDGNESYYVLDFPIGSFSTEWPKQCMDLTFALENSGDHVQVGNPLDIKTVAVFSLGETPVDDGNYAYGLEHDLTVIPNVYTIEKGNSATEGERATGSKYPITATIIVDIAKDENVTNLQVVDDLDGGMQFIGIISNAGCTETQLPLTTSPGGTLELDCGAQTGVLGPDLTITYTYYIPEVDDNNDSILGDNCQWNPLINLAHATADHDFNNTVVSLPQIDANSTVTAKAITMHKTSRISQDAPPAGFGPGDQVEYILTMDISGFATQSDIVISDTIGDGQEFNITAPTDYNLSTGIAGAFNSNNINVVYDSATGTSLIEFNLSNQLIEDGHSPTVDANTTITVKFITTIDDFYKVINNGGHIAMGDVVENSVLLDTTMNGRTCPTEPSHTSNTVATEQMTKTIYAVNGDTNVSAPYLIHPGDTVTYRLKSVMPVKSFFDFKLLDYLPIPFFRADEVTGQGSDGSTAAGTWAIGPDNTYDVAPPILTIDSAQNSLTWTFGDANVTQTGTILDLLFTVTATNEPMADALTLANIGGTKYKNAANVDFGTADLINVITQQPFVKLNKTIMSTSNDQGQTFPTDSLDKVDANDTIRYKIRLENTGHAIAYDVNITDRFEQDGNLGQGLHSCTIVSTDTNGMTGTNTTGDLFAGTYTIESIDALSYFDVTYDCTVNQDANPGNDINNTAALKAYASVPGGPTFVHLIIESQTKLILLEDTKLTKTLYDTSLTDTTGTNLNSGEIAYFEINATLGEGTYVNFAITDPVCDAPPLFHNSSVNVHFNGSDLVVDGTSGASTGTVSYRCSYQATVNNPKTSNTATMTATNITTKTASTNWTVKEPQVSTSKDMSPNEFDAGDETTITLNWTNDTANPAYRCRVEDPLDSSIFNISTISNIVAPAGYSYSLNGNTVVFTYDDNSTKCPDGPASFKIKVKDDAQVGSDTWQKNQINFYGNSLPAWHAEANNTVYNKTVEANNTKDFRLRSPVQPEKIYTATSENNTSGSLDHPDVAIGEVLDVNLTFGFYEGITKAVLLDDRFVDQVFAYVPGSATLTRTDNNLSVSNLTLSPAGTPLTIDDNDLDITSEHIRLDVGDVNNSNSTPTSNFSNLVLSFKIKVKNTNDAKLQAGQTINNRARLYYEDTVSGTQTSSESPDREATVVEPDHSMAKHVTSGSTVQAGSTVSYTLDICNGNGTSSTTGFEWTVSDVLPPELLPDGGYVIRPASMTSRVTVIQSGQTLDANITYIDPGECVYIDYNATVLDTAQFGQRLTNNVNYQLTSLKGKYGDAGAPVGTGNEEPGEENGERTGTDGISGLNNLAGHKSAYVDVDVSSIVKELSPDNSPYAIGEKAHYNIKVGFPKGEAKSYKIIDTLPKGLDFNTSDVTIFVDNNLSHSIDPVNVIKDIDGTTGVQTITFDFGDINTSSLLAKGVEIDYNVTISNIIENQNNDNRLNQARIEHENPNGSGIITIDANPTDPVVIGEPDLLMQKSVVNGAANIQAGSIVEWQVTISNNTANSKTTAYRVNWIDILPPHIAEIYDATLTLTNTNIVLSDTNVTLTSNDLNENNTTISLPEFNLPKGEEIVILFKSKVQNDAVSGETLVNRTESKYQSLLNGGRNATDCGDDDDDSTLNNYCESATAPLTIDAGLSIDKHLLNGSNDKYTIGDTFTYKMTIGLIQGITRDVVFKDLLPEGISCVSMHDQKPGGSMMQYTIQRETCSGRDVEVDFGDIDNPDDGNLTNDWIEFQLTVRVDNDQANQNTNVKTNISSIESNATSVPIYSNEANITIIEPDLNITKTVTPNDQSAGDVVTYTVTVSHTSGVSTADAYDVNLTDILPAGLTYIQGSGQPAGAIHDSGQILTFGISHLVQGNQEVFTYKARIDDNLSANTSLLNDVNATYGSMPDANGTQYGARNGSDKPDASGLNNYFRHAEAPLNVNRNVLTPIKAQDVKVDTNNDGLINAGDILEYNLTVENNLTYAAGDLNITDVLDPNVTLMLNSVQIDGAAVGNDHAWSFDGTWYRYANAGNDIDLSYNIVTNYFEVYWQQLLNPGSILAITYDVKINDGNITEVVFLDGNTTDLAKKPFVLPGTVIDNIFNVDSNRTVPVDSNEVNVTTDQRGIAGIPVKNITGSDQSFTTLPDVAVGEVIDVNLTFAFSGGTTRNVVLRDNYNPAQFSFVFGSETLALSSAAISVTNPVTIVEDGNGFSVDLGDVTNTHYEDLNMTEELTLSFKLQVKNTTAVNRSDTLNDRADVTYLDYNRSGGQPDRNVTLQSPIVSVTVLEPLPSIKKVNSNAAAQPGDPVTYTVTFCNDEANTSTNVTSAFDWTATDVLDVRLHPQAPPRTNPGGTGANMTASFSGQTLSVTIDQLDQGECVNVAYDVLIDAGAVIDDIISNTINMQTTSLSGDITGERTGTGSPVENDLHAFATSNIIIGKPSILKDIVAQQTFYAIGESVDYNVTINLPESVKSLEMNDTLPAGLVYNAGSVRLVVPAGVTVQNDPPTVTQNGAVVTFDLGDVNMTGKQTLYLEFNASVENISSNQENTTLTNKVNMAYIEPDNNKTIILSDVNATAITVGEPTIVMTKMVTSGLVDSQAGDTISYSITMENTGSTTAFATDWIDTLPLHLAEISNADLNGTAYQSGTTTPLVDGDFALSTVNETNDTVALPAFDLPVGNTLTITFDAILQPDVVANEILNNNTTSTWRSILGTGARDGTDGIGSGLNNYAAEANASLEVNATIAITKQVDKSKATIGEELTYKLSVYFIRGITPDVSITDVLPDGLTYISHTTQSTDAGLTFATDTKSGSGQTVVISLGEVSNAATTDDHIDIELKVRVDNVIGNQDGVKPANGGTDTSVTAKFTTPGVGTTEASVINAVTFTITEPDISTTKNVTPDTQALGDEVTYTVRVTNGGTSTAYDLNLTDTLPTGLTYVTGSASIPVIHNGQILTFVLAPLASGASVDISYKATVDLTADTTQPLVNKINGVYGSILDSNGSADGGRNGIDGINGLNNYVFEANATLQPNTDVLTPVKSMTWKQDSNNDTVISAGDLLAYDLSVTNTLAYAVGDVNVTDTLSPDVTLMLNSVQVGGVAVGNTTQWTQAGTWYTYAATNVTLSYDSGTNYFEVYWQNTLNPGQILDVTFDVKINDGNSTTIVFGDNTTNVLNAKPLVDANTTIENIFTVDSNRTVPTPSNEVNVTTDQRGVAVDPVKMLIKTDQPFTDPGDVNIMNTPPVAVGEVIDVEIKYAFSGGVSREVVLRDNYDLQNFVYVAGSAEL